MSLVIVSDVMVTLHNRRVQLLYLVVEEGVAFLCL